MQKLAYLAQPIDQAPASAKTRLQIAELVSILTAHGYHAYRPSRAFSVATEPPDPRIEQINQFALASADLLVAYLPRGVPTIGVPMEIMDALHRSIPVVVVTDIDQSFSLMRPGIHVVHDLEDLLTSLARIHQERADQLRLPTGAVHVVLADGTEVPQRAYDDDAGVDLTCLHEVNIEPGQFVDLRTQVEAVQLPPGHWGLITGRSSTLRNHRLHIPVAVIDPGWRGPLLVGCWNLSGAPVVVRAGQRLAQLILLPNNPAPVLAVAEVSEAKRGLAGFGSTG